MNRPHQAALVGLACVGAAACRYQAEEGPPVEEPPILSEEELVGKLIFFDESLSVNENQACAVCHGAEVGGTGPDEDFNRLAGVYEGSVPGRFGNRKPNSTSYATPSPVLDIDANGEIVGGSFWDGRATGWRLGRAAADQAQGPFLNPLEQALPSGEEVTRRVCEADYAPLFTSVYGESACVDLTMGYDQVAYAITAYEDSAEVNPYDSKYDAWVAGEAVLTPQEQAGLALFEGKAACAECHSTDPGPDGRPAAFTDFTYVNLGMPRNPENPFLQEDTVYIDGEPINPLGEAWLDLGLAGFLDELRRDDAWRSQPFVPPAFASLGAEDLDRLVEQTRGTHRVPTLRNVDERPTPDFVKPFGHNGWFKGLESLVHFYNTRDVLPRCASQATEADALAQGCWPAPEIPENVSTEGGLGNLGLTDAEEDAIVAFLRTLTDGYTPEP
jgi:cytochrome c peroxidase